MIKLKSLLKEFSTRNFKPASEKNVSDTLKVLSNWGFGKAAKSNRKMSKWIEQYKGYPMTTHIQYHELLKPGGSHPSERGSRIRLHQSQYYGSTGPFNPDPKIWPGGKAPTVGTTMVQVKDLDTDKVIGSVYVNTEEFLDELTKQRKFKITKRAS
jgi:hypothetical protein